jgi:hypothetical protein
MGLVAIEGFDYSNSGGPDFYPKWAWLGGITISALGLGRDGIGRYMLIPSSSGTFYAQIHTQDPGTSNSLIVGFALKPPGGEKNDVVQFLNSAGAEVLAIEIQTDDTLDAVNNTAVVSSTTSPLNAGAWNYVEMKILFADGAGGSVDWQLDGVAAGSDPGIDTSYNGPEVFSLKLRGDGTPYHIFDDFYLANTSGATDFFGDSTILTLFPNADAGTPDFTPSEANNYEGVDENPPDDDTTYNESSTSGHEDLFDFAASGLGGSDTIHGIGLNAWATKPTTNPAQLNMTALSVATPFTSSAINIGMGYQRLHALSLTDPDTAAAWTVAGLDAASFGYKRV